VEGSIIVPVHKKGDETDCSNYHGIALLSTSYKVLSNILLSRLFGPKRDEVMRDWRKPRNEKLHNFDSSPNIIRMIK
jgi:hypothetical protein